MMKSDNADEAKVHRWYTQPKFVFFIISLINLTNFIDRGIIPGSTNEFNAFIEQNIHTDTPDVYLGLLQSSFVVGYVVGSMVFSHLVHQYGRFFLVAVGCSIWILALLLSGASFHSGSYVFLLFSRMLSGVGEASVHTNVPPWIQQMAPPAQTGAWLAVFYTAVPVGTALGYVYSSIISGAIGWQWAFFIECIAMAPLVLYLFLVSHAFPAEHLHTASLPSLKDELRDVCSSWVFMAISLASAAESACLHGLSTFASSFFLGLGFFDTQAMASGVFGAVICLTGLICTPIGGIVLDRLLRKHSGMSGQMGHTVLVPQEEEGRHREGSDGMQMVMLTAPEEVEGDGDGPLQGQGTKEVCGSVSGFQGPLDDITFLTTALSTCSVILLCLSYFAHRAAGFIVMTALGCGLLFATFPAINMGIMLSVPVKHRAFALGVNTVIMHVFGDVPSPVVVGYLKDSLAPDCVADTDDDSVASSEACRDDAMGLRRTILFTELWMWWAVFFFVSAWLVNRRRAVSTNAREV